MAKIPTLAGRGEEMKLHIMNRICIFSGHRLRLCPTCKGLKRREKLYEGGYNLECDKL